MRASILALGPLLARCGEARVSLPGGCAIGLRPVDQHVKGLQAMGAEIDLEHGYINARARRGSRARASCFDVVTVTGTENLMMAATLADGATTLENAAREPEVVDLARCLRRDGRADRRRGHRPHRHRRRAALHGATHAIMPDRIETGTFLAAVGGDRRRRRRSPAPQPDTLDAVLDKLREAGADIAVDGDDDPRRARDGALRAVNVRTAPYPGFPDRHAGAVHGARDARRRHVGHHRDDLREPDDARAGAACASAPTSRSRATPRSSGASTKLTGANVMATDLRASACLVIAGLVAEGETTIDRIYHLDRGYERIEEKLSALGARIRARAMTAPHPAANCAMRRSATRRPTPSATIAALLFAVERAPQRARARHRRARCRSRGVDLWTAYELTWLDARGKPQVAHRDASTVPADSPSLVESKSVKLYLGVVRADALRVGRPTWRGDRARPARGDGRARRRHAARRRTSTCERSRELAGECLDELPIACDRYDVDAGRCWQRGGRRRRPRR